MTTKEHQAHQQFIARRDAIIAAALNTPATHVTTRKTWHGCDIPEGTHLIASAELQALFDAHDKHKATAPAQWFIIAGWHGHLCHLWTNESKPITA
ncbi:MAG: hypothetical protein KGL39_45380 [Patescibacteria group bacterium]|nr:hypothetical protein [Patescibacteria group bacterium]